MPDLADDATPAAVEPAVTADRLLVVTPHLCLRAFAPWPHRVRSPMDDERAERPLERADRNMVELLQELRVAQAGVQILFAFLLSLAFTERFARIDQVQLRTYVVTLLLAVTTAGLLVAPAAVHRMTFQRGVKPQTVQLGHRLFALGLALLALTLSGSVLLVLDIAVGRGFAVPVAAAVAVMLLALWFALPIPLLRGTQR